MKRERPDRWMLWDDLISTVVKTNRPPLRSGFLRCYSRNSSQLEMEYTDLLVVSRQWARQSLSTAEFNDDIYRQQLKIVPENPWRPPDYLSPSIRAIGLKRERWRYLDEDGNDAAYAVRGCDEGCKQEIFIRYDLLVKYAEMRQVGLLWCIQCARSSELYPKELGIIVGSRSVTSNRYNLEINISSGGNYYQRLRTTCGVIGKVLLTEVVDRQPTSAYRRLGDKSSSS